MSDRKTVCLVVGTRPEAIKMAPLYRELQRSEVLRPVLLSTGQHRHMLDQALSIFGMKPDHDLELMQSSQSLASLTSRAITAISEYLDSTKPALVLVQGDTTSVLAGALSAFYNQIPVGHVEAGLRTGDIHSPWPEEMNRRLVSPLCRWNFVPTQTSLQNLRSEQIKPDSCYVTGNTVVDALLWARDLISDRCEEAATIGTRIGVPSDFNIGFLQDARKQFVLVTGHRRESFGSGFDSICAGLREFVDNNPNIGLLFPVHLNPAVRRPVLEKLGNHPRIALIEPVDYLDMIWLIQRCRFIISDSGGIQEEAPSLAKPVLVTRNNTERPEGVEAGTCRLIGTDSGRIVSEAQLLMYEDEYLRRCKIANPYGDGNASHRIRTILDDSFRSAQ